MIEREDLPLLVIERNGTIAAVNSAAEQLFGMGRKELVRRMSSELLGRLPIAAALAGRVQRVSCPTSLAGSGRLVLNVELQPIGTGSSSCLLGIVSSSASHAASVRHVRYMVSTRAGEFGRLLLLSRDGDERTGSQLLGKQCHRVLYRSETPCRGCPLIGDSELGDTRVGVVNPGNPDGTVVLVTGQRTNDEAFTLTASYLPRSVLARLLRAQIENLADRAALSPRERQVLNLILMGRSAREIGKVLGISAHTAKFHQAKILQKLGADSRYDLLRLLL